MITNNIKRYAPRARNEFRHAITQRLSEFGIISDGNGGIQILDAISSGSVLTIGKYNYDGTKFESPRNSLVELCKNQSFDSFVEQMAYTWFNRLCAIRFMEIHDYFDHGFRVLSHPTKPNGFQILEHAQEMESELNIDRESIADLLVAGDKDEELYRELLLGQCRNLNKYLPFLFDELTNGTELLLPENLIRSDSIIRGLVDDIPESDWNHIEIIGWLYQFYNSEKKDQVFKYQNDGNSVKSEDIPAATQLFTPNWIVKYLVQNSVGRKWLEINPDSDLKLKMDYYIDPAEQFPEVDEIIKSIEIEKVTPEEIKILDPTCGSGHILIEAYNIMKQIYEESGYRQREIPKLILGNNLFGLDIDDRAVQLACFSLMMRARKDDRDIFNQKIELNVVPIKTGNHVNPDEVWSKLKKSSKPQTGVYKELAINGEQCSTSINSDKNYQLLNDNIKRFSLANTLGALIEVPDEERDELKLLNSQLSEIIASGDAIQKISAKEIKNLVHQAMILSFKYDAVIANPPYMGNKGMNGKLKKFVEKPYKNCKTELSVIFMDRAFKLLKENGFNSQINMQSWMFLSSFEEFRRKICNDRTIITMAHFGAKAFAQISGDVVQTVAWVMKKSNISRYNSRIYRLVEGEDDYKNNALKNRNYEHEFIAQDEFGTIPSFPIAYWVSDNFKELFKDNFVEDVTDSKGQNKTAKNTKYLRNHWEVPKKFIGAKNRWMLYSKGGGFRRWAGNLEDIINWTDEARSFYKTNKSSSILPEKLWYEIGISWGITASTKPTFRFLPQEATSDMGGPAVYFIDSSEVDFYLAMLNSSVATEVLNVYNPTVNCQVKDVRNLPIFEVSDKEHISNLSKLAQQISKGDWDSFETSFEFKKPRIFSLDEFPSTSIEEDVRTLSTHNENKTKKLHEIEEEINREFISRYNLADEIETQVPIEDVSLFWNPQYNKTGITDNYDFCRSQVSTQLCSFSVGCMMGRFTLDGSEANNESDENNDVKFISSDNNGRFPIDSDGIIPITDFDWFKDDVVNRFQEFIKVVWGLDEQQENLDFIAESLCIKTLSPRNEEHAIDTIRRYFSTQFYKDHVKLYKKRPIYWLFSSGKKKAFECLVYIHRYNPGTLSRMRIEYVLPVLGKYDVHIEQLEKQIETAETTAKRNKLVRELDEFQKKLLELRRFDENLRHFADSQVSIDLEDGVKVNYGKFGNLLAKL